MKNFKNPNGVTAKFRLGGPGQRPKMQEITDTNDWHCSGGTRCFSVPFFLGILAFPKTHRSIQLFAVIFVAHRVQEIINYTKTTLLYSLFMFFFFLVDVNCCKMFNTRLILIPPL